MNSISYKKAALVVFAHKRLVLTGVFLFFVGIFGIISFSKSNEAEAFACSAVAGTNNWSNPASWTGCNSSYPGSPGNGNGDTVTIPNSAVVMTADTSVTVASISFTGGNTAASVSISNGITLTVSGTVTINAPTAAVVKQLAVGSGAITANGFTVSGGSTAGYDAILSASTGTITTTGGITFSGTVAQSKLTTTGAATVNLTGSTISANGTASINSATTLVSTGTSALNLASTWGILSVPSGTLTLGNINITFAGAVSISGTLTTVASSSEANFSSTVTVNSGGSLNFNTSKVTSFNGNIIMNGTTFNSGSLTATLTGTIAISGSSNVTFGGAVTVTGAVTNNSAAAVIVTGAFSGAGSWTQGTGSTLRLQGTTTTANTVTTFDASTNVNTVDYNGGNQTAKAVTYHHLTLSNNSTKTLTGVTTVNGDFTSSGSASASSPITSIAGTMTIGGTSNISLSADLTVATVSITGGTLTTGAFIFTVSGTTTITTGTLTINNNTGAKTLTGQVTLNGGTLNGSSSNIILTTGITNNGGSVAITGTVTISTAGVIFAGSSVISITNITVTSPGTVINNGSVTVPTLLSGTGSWTQGTNSTLTPGGNSNSPITITTLDASSNVNTVNYNGYNVSCKLVQYYHLSFTNTLNMTCNLNTVILGNFTLGGGVIWSNASTTIEVNGNFTATSCGQCFTQQPFIVHGTSQINVDFSLFNNSTQTYDGDVTFTGGGLRSSYGTSTVTFGGNVINNGGVGLGLSLPGTTIFTSTTATISGTGPTRMDNIQINGSASLTNNTTINSYSSPGISGTGTFIMGTNSVFYYVGSAAPTITTFNASSNVNTFNYASGGQTARVATYHHLLLSGSGSTTLTGITTINGNFTVSGSGTTNAPFTTIGGNISTSGTVTLNLTANAVVTGSIDIGSGSTLTGHSGTLTIANDFTNAGTFNHNNGTVIFNDNAQITVIAGSPIFNNFTVTTAGKTIQVTSGQTLNIVGALTLTGVNGNNVVLISTTGSSTFNMTFQNASDAVTYTTISWSACASSYDINVYDGTSTNGGNNGACWLFSEPGSISISGTATGNNAATVKVAVNGAVSGSTTTVSSNSWLISNVVVPTGGVIVVWVDSVTDTNEATAVAKYDGTGNVTGMDLSIGTLTLGSDDNSTLLVPDFSTFDYDNDEDILFIGTTSTLVGYSSDLDSELAIMAGDTLSVGHSGLSESIYVRDLIVEGTLISSSTGQIVVNGSYNNNGTYTANSGTFIFASDKNNNTMSGNMSGNGGKFYNLYFEGVGAKWTPSGNIEAANDLIILDGELVAPSNLTVAGNFSNYGKFTAGSGTVTLTATDTGNMVTGLLLGDNKFNNLTLNGSGGEWNVSGSLEINGDLEVTTGNFIGSGNLIVNGGSITGGGMVYFSGNNSMTNVETVITGGTHSCAVTKLTDVYCWGTNSNGTLGNTSAGNSSITPVKVMAGEATGADARNGYLTNIKYVNAGYYHTCAISYSDFTYCWGQALYGKLGDGQNAVNRTTPVKVLKGAAAVSDNDGTYLTNMKSMTMSYYHTCGVSNAGIAYCWGGGQYGALGDNQTAERTTPVRVQDGLATGSDTDGTYLVNVDTIHAGQMHSCALSKTGRVYCWGRRDSGNLGNNQITASEIPTPVIVEDGVATGDDTDGTYLANINYLAVDSQESCAISNLGNTYCWGYGSDGQLGDNQTASHRSTPVKVLAGQATGNDTDGTYLVNLSKISLGDYSTCGLSVAGNTYCWGTNIFGVIGNADGGSYLTPRKVVKGQSSPNDTDGTYLTNIQDLAIGQYSVCSLSNSQMVYCWGYSSGGLGSQPNTSSNPSPLIAFTQTNDFVSIDTGHYNTCGVTATTHVYCAGWNPLGNLGDGTLTTKYAGVLVHDGAAAGSDTDGTYLYNIKQMGLGTYFGCALSYAGNVYCWGYAAYNSLGEGQATTDRTTPVRVHDGDATGADTDGTYLTNINNLAVGYDHVCATANSGLVYCWGSGTSGQMGDNQTASNRLTPVKVQDGVATGSDTDGTYLINVRQISGRGMHTCAVTYAGNVYCWGTGGNGQLGDSQTGNRSTPVKVQDGVATGPDTDGTYLTNIKEIAAGVQHTCAISLAGNTYCWGKGGQGQLGDAQTASDRLTPIKVEDGVATGLDTNGTYLTNVRKIEAGGTHTCALTRSGYTYCWGPGSRIGVNSSSTFTTPAKVVKGAASSSHTDGVYLTNQIDLSASLSGAFDGGGNSCWMAINGQFYCSGTHSNTFGQLSNASYDMQMTPMVGATATPPSALAMNVTLNGTGNLGNDNDWTLPSVSLGSTSTGTTTLAGSGELKIRGTLTNSSNHTLNAGSKILTITNDFANAGTFEGDTGTLVFDSRGEVSTVLGSGVTNFNNLTITTPGKTVKFESGEMFTINGALAITGSLDEEVIITSTDGETQWLVNHQGTENVTYAIISWSGCSSSPGSEYVDVSGGTNTDAGNNDTCWSFVPVVEIIYGPGSGPTGGGPGSIFNSGQTSNNQNGGSGPSNDTGEGEPGAGGSSGGGQGSGGGGGASP